MFSRSWLAAGFVLISLADFTTAEDVTSNGIGMKLALVEAGKFKMGSPSSEKERGNDERMHRVKLTQPFYLGVNEITQGQWQEVMNSEPWKGKTFVEEGSDYPATHVDWNEAVKFCAELTKMERAAGRIGDSQQYRLPTEAEWEYACRAGSTTCFSFGDDPAKLGRYAWNNENTYDRDERYAHRVGLKKPNAWGLYDMHCNVWEWCSDWYGDYPDGRAKDPLGATAGSYRVIRGGGWLDYPPNARSANRFKSAPDHSSSKIGLRVVLSRIPGTRD